MAQPTISFSCRNIFLSLIDIANSHYSSVVLNHKLVDNLTDVHQGFFMKYHQSKLAFGYDFGQTSTILTEPKKVRRASSSYAMDFCPIKRVARTYDLQNCSYPKDSVHFVLIGSAWENQADNSPILPLPSANLS